MKLSARTIYAINAVLQLAENQVGGLVCSATLAEQGEMPDRYLLQILRTLTRAGIVGSARGRDGGYALARRPDAISLRDIIEAVDGPLPRCGPMAKGVPAVAAERLQHALSSIRDVTRQRLQEITLGDLMGEPCHDSVASQAGHALPAPHSWEQDVSVSFGLEEIPAAVEVGLVN